MTNNKRNDGGVGERKGRRGESKECVDNSKKGVIRNVNFVESKGRKKERRKEDDIMEEEEVNAEDGSEGEDKDKDRAVRENEGEGEEEEEGEGQGEGEEEEEGKGEKEEGEESTTADALRLMTPWSYQVGRLVGQLSNHYHNHFLCLLFQSVISSPLLTSPHLISPHFSTYFSTLISPLTSHHSSYTITPVTVTCIPVTVTLTVPNTDAVPQVLSDCGHITGSCTEYQDC